MKRFAVLFAMWNFGRFAFGSSVQTVPLAEFATRAIEQSKLTQTDGIPFHLKATIVEVSNAGSEYAAQIEEYWISNEKMRRTITSPRFSQTLIVNGDKVSDDSQGEYLPWWLNDLATAIVDPLPMIETLKSSGTVMPKPNGIGALKQLRPPADERWCASNRE